MQSRKCGLNNSRQKQNREGLSCFWSRKQSLKTFNRWRFSSWARWQCKEAAGPESSMNRAQENFWAGTQKPQEKRSWPDPRRAEEKELGFQTRDDLLKRCMLKQDNISYSYVYIQLYTFDTSLDRLFTSLKSEVIETLLSTSGAELQCTISLNQLKMLSVLYLPLVTAATENHQSRKLPGLNLLLEPKRPLLSLGVSELR